MILSAARCGHQLQYFLLTFKNNLLMTPRYPSAGYYRNNSLLLISARILERLFDLTGYPLLSTSNRRSLPGQQGLKDPSGIAVLASGTLSVVWIKQQTE